MTKGLVAITGAARGIGAALAREAVSRGYRVALFDRDSVALDELQSELGEADCAVCTGDVTSEADLAQFASTVLAIGAPLQLTFANAGVLRAGAILDQDLGEIEQMFAINTLAAIKTARALVPMMQQHGAPSVFVLTGSTSMLTVAAGYGGYAASKHALLALAEALDAELAAAGSPVRAAILCPAAVQTGIADGSSDLLDKLKRRMETHGISAEAMARLAFDGIEADHSVIFSSDPSKRAATKRLEALLSGQFVSRSTAGNEGSR